MFLLRINNFKAMLFATIISLSIYNVVSTKTDHRNIQKLAAASNNFSLNLLRELTAGNESRNIFISPVSISMTFGMLFNGAAGDTAKELRSALGYRNAGLNDKNIHDSFKQLLSNEMKKSDKFTLNAANAILVDKELGILPNYKRKMEEIYSASILNVDFKTNTSKVLNGINTWVKFETNGKISHFLNSLDPNTVFIIINAVYFKGFWKYPFHPKRTHSQTFYNNDLPSEAKLVPMMHISRNYRFASVSGCDVLELPYIQDNVVMLIILPTNGLTALEQKLTHKSIAKIRKAMRFTRLSVYIPKFKMEFYSNLAPELMKLGIRSIFDGADFSGMISNGSAIDEFLHKAVIEVNEEGTEAAAVSAAITRKSLPTTFIVNRPFFFVIVDKKTNFTLFLGSVRNL